MLVYLPSFSVLIVECFLVHLSVPDADCFPAELSRGAFPRLTLVLTLAYATYLSHFTELFTVETKKVNGFIKTTQSTYHLC